MFVIFIPHILFACLSCGSCSVLKISNARHLFLFTWVTRSLRFDSQVILSLSLKTSDFAIVFGYSESIISHTRYVFFSPQTKTKIRFFTYIFFAPNSFFPLEISPNSIFPTIKKKLSQASNKVCLSLSYTKHKTIPRNIKFTSK